jgi:hypothetical protein
MDILNKLISASNSKSSLSAFIDDYNQELYDFLLTQSYRDLKRYKEDIDRYILSHLKVIKTLDFDLESTRVFVLILLEVAERFSFLTSFQRLFKLLHKNDCELGSRIQASSSFFIGVRRISDYEKRVDQILHQLSVAYNVEDSEERVVGTLINFYAQVVHNFALQNQDRVLLLRDHILSKREDLSFYFLRHELIDKVFSIDISDHIVAFEKIKSLLDIFLERTNKYLSFTHDSFMMEEGTSYVDLLGCDCPDFFALRDIAVDEYQKIADKSVYYSLDKGVRVLTSESQLFAYLYSYGKMHYNKVTSAFKALPDNLNDKCLEIIDWGCGQALASVCFFDYIKEKGCELIVHQVTLIEPSKIALKRGSLHVKKYELAGNIRTVNKDLDSLVDNDIVSDNTHIKVHLFSNILDIEKFSLKKLISFIENNFQGENYFVCASPYINYLRTSRLDGFMSSFSRFDSFEKYLDVDHEKGEWINGWTRSIRVFKANIESSIE